MKPSSLWLVALLLLALIPSETKAACTAVGGGSASCSTEGEAFLWVSDPASLNTACAPSTPQSYPNATFNGTNWRNSVMCANGSPRSITGSFSTTCASYTGTAPASSWTTGERACSTGCVIEATAPTTDGTLRGLFGTGLVCKAACQAGYARVPAWIGTCTLIPPPDADGDGTPDSSDAFPTNPSETTDSDGDGFGNNADAFDSDPSENTDADADGEGDNADPNPADADNGQDNGTGNESDNTSTGGGTCDSRPVSSGDAILSQIALQAWETRCAITKGNAGIVTGDPTNCNATYACTGDTVQCAQVNLLRKSVCTTATIGTPSTSNADGNGNGQPDWTETGAGSVSTSGDPQGGGVSDIAIGPSMLDMGGLFGGTRSCPTLGTLNLGYFGTVSLDEQPWWCTLVALLAAIFPLMGSFIALRILMGDA